MLLLVDYFRMNESIFETHALPVQLIRCLRFAFDHGLHLLSEHIIVLFEMLLLVIRKSRICYLNG